MDASGLLDRLTSAEGLQDLAGRAKSLWSGQTDMTKGVVAGGVLSLLLSAGGRSVLGAGARLGGAALIGGLAWRAWSAWKTGQEAPALAAPESFDPLDDEAAAALSRKLVQAMIAAARADGLVSEDERARIDAALADLGLDPPESALILAELEAEPDVRRIAALAADEAEAAQIYAASLLVIQQQSLEEKGYLAMLSAALNLHPDLVAQLHLKAATPD